MGVLWPGVLAYGENEKALFYATRTQTKHGLNDNVPFM